MITAVAVRCGEADLRHSLLPGVSGQRRASAVFGRRSLGSSGARGFESSDSLSRSRGLGRSSRVEGHALSPKQ